ncbi:leukocyte surface antigen CD53-like [Xenia sp. Carnegie-2017]|uniref:leukocyte surface antigen CD53-like n=1 Tax=Xenia sp. Carnegie-2017 TaxID=2897299 RepID=UPI001F03858F|nr:leukocyte surface antigen CD53-like [Xenia sp. Carnegie-2017]
MELQPLQNQNGATTQPANTKVFIPSSSKKMMMIPGRTRFGKSYQFTRFDKVILVLTIIFNSLILLLALAALALGIFLNTYRGSYADLCGDNEWFVAAGFLLGFGSVLVIAVVISYIAICTKNTKLLMMFIFTLIMLFIGEVTAGIYVFARRDHIEDRYQACMINAYQNQYFYPSYEHVTKAWDLFQRRFKCCGVQESLDFLKNNRAPPGGPKACGGDRDDAFARQACFPVIKREVLDNFYLIGGTAFIIAVVQLITLLSDFVLLRIYRKVEEYE